MYDAAGVIILKEKLRIDANDSAHSERVAEWDHMRDMVDKVERGKHLKIEDVSLTQAVADSSAITKPPLPSVKTTKVWGLSCLLCAQVYGLRPTEECASCGKIVYPVEKVVAEKKILHSECLRFD